MNKLERIEIIDIIGRELQNRMTFSEIDSYLDSYNIETKGFVKGNSKWVYVKDILPYTNDNIILQIASELKIDHPSLSEVENDLIEPNFWKPGHFKLFISHLSTFKEKTSLLKNDLEKYGISAFVAHEDIEPTKQWQDEIEKGLFTMDALCAILMPGFKESNWTDQEIGVAIGRKLLVIPIRKGLDPYGFIGKYQGYQSHNKKIHEVGESIFQIISKNPKTKNKYLNIICELFLMSNSFEDGLNRIKIINKIEHISSDKVLQIHTRIIENKNLKNKDILSEFNKLSEKFELKAINLNDFDKNIFEDINDLPF